VSERIHVVEDEPLVRDLIVLNLEHENYIVTASATFDEGLRALTGAPPAMAIVDVMLPGGDGFTLTRTARDRGLRCPILMLTARAESSSKVRGLDCGADDYLTKPFDVA
jgi:DNA-binding response OmpR family regulator